jgi:hypothetical protein
MHKKIILLLATMMGLALSMAAFAEGQFDQDRARVEEDKRVVDHDRDRLRDASVAIQRDRQKLMEDQRRMESDRNRSRDQRHDRRYEDHQGGAAVTLPTPPTPPTIPTTPIH